jgi:hypothetical protein
MCGNWLLCLPIVLISMHASFGQCSPPSIAGDYAFITLDDYRRADQKAASAIDWLLMTDLEQCKDDRQGLEAFVLVWLSGHPDLKVEFEPSVFPVFDEFPELLFPALFSIAHYQMHTPVKERSLVDAHVAVLNTLCEITQGAKRYRNNAPLKQIRKANRKKRAHEYVSSALQE